MENIHFKKLIYNANHRGMKETDVLLGKFASAHLSTMDDQSLLLFQQLLEEQDADILAWCVGQTTIPTHYHALIVEILAFHDQES
ncbi:succinate dehydrogenase assembly factor 2 [Candidatus Odyssella acanthamoebae]|uniref:succinate dehydrogenase assembly factor 2 n=1 Tax=Candidatus Odyssella acanthamoebae TaxID=91604 RepID=UPI0005703635|nr:succinate dehydrogenase assembly factor 2 [Candidatus Paracaedibacter acanthamoebae]